jgi:hypothetical protein
MQPVRSVRQQVTVFMQGAARHPRKALQTVVVSPTLGCYF